MCKGSNKETPSGSRVKLKICERRSDKIAEELAGVVAWGISAKTC